MTPPRKRHPGRPSVPEATVLRLSVCRQCLRRLADVGVTTTSSAESGRLAGLNPAQVRRDFS